jgi:hypothetical protein
MEDPICGARNEAIQQPWIGRYQAMTRTATEMERSSLSLTDTVTAVTCSCEANPKKRYEPFPPWPGCDDGGKRSRLHCRPVENECAHQIPAVVRFSHGNGVLTIGNKINPTHSLDSDGLASTRPCEWRPNDKASEVCGLQGQPSHDAADSR